MDYYLLYSRVGSPDNHFCICTDNEATQNIVDPEELYLCPHGLQRVEPFQQIWAAVAKLYRYRIVAGFVTSSSPVQLKSRRVGQKCTQNLSRAQTSSRWCGIEEKGVPTRYLTMVQNDEVRRQKLSCS
ncbi:uncharacterized protein TNCV_2607761 [Trichonephila clavipes]|uniref:Uncharacterized protein n=1 Tax=Trichonephila clavipes TaxID=2585209 RepID=A0A8X6RTP8_TRICX|nr:uncharacterized protein TNCV_2607761 [Trichonephila clavipes]